MSQTTIVTAFITKVNNIDFRSYDTYLQYGNKLLSLDIPTIIFILVDIVQKLYDNALSSLDILQYIKTSNNWTDLEK